MYLKEKTQIIKLLCKKYNVKYRFKKQNGIGFAHTNTETISLDPYFLANHRKARTKKYQLDHFVSTALHEICHILAKRANKYKIYHSHKSLSIKEWYVYKKTAIFAELYVDNWAEGLCQVLFPKIKYIRSYRTKQDRKWLLNYINNPKVL